MSVFVCFSAHAGGERALPLPTSFGRSNSGYKKAASRQSWQSNFEYQDRDTRDKRQREDTFKFSQTYRKDFLTSRLHFPTPSLEFVWIFQLAFSFYLGTMMFTAFNTECDSSSRCSTASPSGDNLGYYPSPAGSYCSMGSPQSQVCLGTCYSTFLTKNLERYSSF